MSGFFRGVFGPASYACSRTAEGDCGWRRPDLTHYLQVSTASDGADTLLVSSAGKLDASAPAANTTSAANVGITVSGIGYDALKSLVAGAEAHIKVDHA